MADTNPKVMDRVREELSKDPKIGAKDLQEKVQKDFPEIGKLTARQFHARYPLQLKRSQAAGKKKRAGRKASKAKPATASKRGGRRAAAATARGRAKSAAAAPDGDANRDKIRSELLQLVKAVASADGKAGMVDLVSGIDRYVDRVVKAAAPK